MADPSCTGPDCFFTGGPYDSQATPGKCTGTGGYIADAEIEEIITGSRGEVQQYVDAKSNRDILIYDNNQWVAYMGPQIKASRKSLYKGLNMGGITDWATDLQEYHAPPTRPGVFVEINDWDTYGHYIRNGDDPLQLGNRTGNSSELTCTNDAVTGTLLFSPSERWDMLDCDNAWNDVIAVYKEMKSEGSSNMPFSALISQVIHANPNSDCGSLLGTHNCGQTLQCNGFDTTNSGPAGWLIWNSFVAIHQVQRPQNLN